MAEIIVDYLRRRIVIYAVVVAMLALGTAAGGIAARAMDAETQGELADFLGGYVGQLESGAGASAPASGPMVLEVLRGAGLPWLLGMTVIGGPLVLALAFLRGFSLGFTLVFLFERLSYKGILLALCGVAPHALFAVPGAVLACGAAMALSFAAIKSLAGRRDEGPILAHFIVATALCGAAALLFAAGAWVQANLSPILLQAVARYVSFSL